MPYKTWYQKNYQNSFRIEMRGTNYLPHIIFVLKLIRWIFPVCLFFVINVSLLKGTVRVVSSDSSSKDANARFTAVPLNALSDQV